MDDMNEFIEEPIIENEPQPEPQPEPIIYKITLADGTEIENLAINGNNFISDEELTESTFARKLHTVTITGSDGSEEIIDNAELISLRKEGDKTWFIIREIPASVMKERKIQADIEYIAMMTDVNLEEE